MRQWTPVDLIPKTLLFVLVFAVNPRAGAQNISTGYSTSVAPSRSGASNGSTTAAVTGDSTSNLNLTTPRTTGSTPPQPMNGSWAGTVAPLAIPATTAPTASATAVSPVVVPASDAGSTYIAPPSTINPGANQGQGSQTAGAAINAAVAAAMMAACMATTPPNIALCMMGAMAGMQAAQDAGAGDQSGDTAAASQYNAPAGAVPVTAAPTAVAAVPTGTVAAVLPVQTGQAGFLAPKIAAGNQALANAGYNVSANGITGPNGSFTPASAFNSSDSMAAAGFSQSTIKQAEKIIADATKDGSNLSKISGSAVAEGSAAGPGSSDHGGSDSYSPKFNANPFALSAAQKQSMVAGKTVLFDGDPIGVRGQDIFQMVHSAYEKKRVANHFIEDGVAGGVVMRAPATVNRIK